MGRVRNLITNQFQIRGNTRTLQAIQKMIPAHAKMVSTTNDWDIEVVSESDGVTLIITPGSTEDYIKLKALGFFWFHDDWRASSAPSLADDKGAGH